MKALSARKAAVKALSALMYGVQQVSDQGLQGASSEFPWRNAEEALGPGGDRAPATDPFFNFPR